MVAGEIYGKALLWAVVIVAAFIVIKAGFRPMRPLSPPGAVTLPEPVLPEFQEWLAT